MKLARLHYRLFLLYGVFFLSGAAALVYQISWSRQIGLLFGHTIHAAALTLSAFFAGTALGYLAGAKVSGRLSPLLGYGFAELAAAAWSCAIPALLTWTDSAAFLSHPEFGRQTAVRAVYCFLLLLPATMALGFTLPMMADALSSDRRGSLSDAATIRRISLAYSFNTIGALAAVLATTSFLLISLGVSGSSYLAAGLAAFCALVAIALHSVEPVTENRELSRSQTAPVSGVGASTWIWIALAALSGFGTLALEVLYTRMFSLVFHNSTYTFGAVVAAFLASLAAGAALAASLHSRYRVETLLAAATGMGGAATILSMLAFVWVTDLDYFRFGESFTQYMLGAAALTCFIIAPPIVLLGMTLPLIWKAAGRESAAGAAVGILTAVNTIAAASGALAASFLLLPVLGLWPSFVLIGATYSSCGIAFCFVLKHPLWGVAGAATVVALTALGLLATTEADARLNNDERIVRRWDSAYGWIDLVRDEKTESFRVRQNLHYRFGRTGSNPREFKLAHIPLLLHERPEEVLFLGLGTGLTAGGAITHDEVKSVTAVELIPEVVEAAAALAEHNNAVTSHPRTEVRVDDARHYLLTVDRCFDVIVADLFVPWESETGYLYTVEHYRIGRERLKAGGLYCQWLPLYQLGTAEFEMIADSFASVFPRVTLWWGDMDASRPLIALVGGNGPIDLDTERLEGRLAAIRRSAGSLDEGIRTPDRLFDNYAGDWPLRNGVLLNTDEHPHIEFSTPISNRDDRMIRDRALLRYCDAVIFRLPANNVHFRSRGEPAEHTTTLRRARQRVMVGGVDAN